MGYPMSAILILAKYLMWLPLQDNLGSWQSKTLTQVEQNDQFCWHGWTKSQMEPGFPHDFCQPAEPWARGSQKEQ
jgi:hypothetical protein